MPCFAPSEVVTSTAAAAVGRIAERFIADDYLVFVGRPTFFPASEKDFSDIHSGFANTTLYVSFLKGNNPNLSSSELLWLKMQAGLTKVPDLMTHDAPIFEYYEIKPASPDGLAAGYAKLAALDAFYHYLSLPYEPGKAWAPSAKFEIARGLIMGCEVRIYLHFWRHTKGLILYELCVEGQLQELAAKVSIAVILAGCVAILLMSGGGAVVPA